MAKSKTNPSTPSELGTAQLSRRLIQMAKHIADVRNETIAAVFDRLAGEIITTEYRASRVDLDSPSRKR